MEQIKIGDRVKMVSRSTGEEIGVEGTLDRLWIPDEYPDVIIDGKSHDMTDEGDSYNLVKIGIYNDDKLREEGYQQGYDRGYDVGWDRGYDIGFEEGLEGY